MSGPRSPVFWCIAIVLVLGLGLPLGAVWTRAERLQIEVSPGFIGVERVAPPYLYVQGARYFMVIRRADAAETRRLYSQLQAALIAYTAQ